MPLTRLAALLLAATLLLAGCGAPESASDTSGAKPKLSELLAEQAAKNEPAIDWREPVAREPYITLRTFQKQVETLFYNKAYGVALAGNGTWDINGKFMFYTDFFNLPGVRDTTQTIDLGFSQYSAYINFIPLSCYQAFTDSKFVENYPQRLGTAFALADGDIVLTYAVSSQLPIVGGDQKLHNTILSTMHRLADGENSIDSLVYIEDDTKGTA